MIRVHSCGYRNIKHVANQQLPLYQVIDLYLFCNSDVVFISSTRKTVSLDTCAANWTSVFGSAGRDPNLCFCSILPLKEVSNKPRVHIICLTH